MEATCTAKEFCGHRDPYTGDPLAVSMFVLPGGRVLYRITGGYDVATAYGTMGEAVAAWSRKDGIMGLRDLTAGYVCAWTGNRLTPAGSSGSHWFAGGFAPGLFRTREEILAAFASMEGRPAPSAPERVETPREPAPAPRCHEHDISEDTMKRAESLVGTARRTMGVSPASPVSMFVSAMRGTRK